MRRKILEAELQRRVGQSEQSLKEKEYALRRGMSVSEFSQRYGPGRTKVYEEINAGRLRARKCGKLTIIGHDDAEDWFRHLPVIEAANTSEEA